MKNIVLVNGLRVFKPSGAISAVLREQKTERAMKAIMLLNGMRQKFSMGGNGGESCDNLSAEDLMKDITPQQLKEIGSSFDAFDTSGDGNIDSGEFLQLMQSLGIKLSEEEAEEKLKILDEDNDGTVSRLEFIRWHVKSLSRSTREPTIEELVDQLFELFDTGGDEDDGTVDPASAEGAVRDVSLVEIAYSIFDASISRYTYPFAFTLSHVAGACFHETRPQNTPRECFL